MPGARPHPPGAAGARTGGVPDEEQAGREPDSVQTVDVFRHTAKFPRTCVQGAAVEVPTDHLERLYRLAWFCHSYSLPQLRIGLPAGANFAEGEPVENAQVTRRGDTVGIGFRWTGRLSGGLRALAGLSERLGSLPDGSVVELDAAFIDEVEPGVEKPAGLHRYRGTVRGGRLVVVEEAFPTADAGRLNAALALSAQCEGDVVDVGHAGLRDELLAALRENEFFENNPAVASGGTSVAVSKPEPVLLNVVAAEAFKRMFRDDWPLPEEDDDE